MYNTSKGAQANLTRCLAIEYGHEGIRVNGICPTYAKTSLTRAFFDDKDFDQMFADSDEAAGVGHVELNQRWDLFVGINQAGAGISSCALWRQVEVADDRGP